MDFIRNKTKDFYLLDTKVENIFISEYLAAAPGDYVKVFLFGSMCAEHGIRQSVREMSRQLSISESDIGKAWNYWEKYGVIKKHYLDEGGKVDFCVEFISLKELMYGKATAPVQGEEEKPETNIFGNEDVKYISPFPLLIASSMILSSSSVVRTTCPCLYVSLNITNRTNNRASISTNITVPIAFFAPPFFSPCIIKSLPSLLSSKGVTSSAVYYSPAIRHHPAFFL